MAKRPKVAFEKSLSPDDAQLKPETGAKRFNFNDPKWSMVQNDIFQAFVAAMDGRSRKLADLEVFNDMYELAHHGEGAGSPWVGASDILPPIIPAELEALRDYIIMAVFTPRLFLAQGQSAEEQKYAPRFEKWLNSLLMKPNITGDTIYETLISVIQASGRDGTAGILATWVQKKREVPTISWVESTDSQGNPVLDEDDMPVRERVFKTITEITKEPFVQLLTSKDVYFSPPEARNFQTAACSFVNLWLMEDELEELAAGMGDNEKTGAFSREALEMIYSYNPNGQTDVPTDPEGDFDKDAGGQLSTGQGQGSITGDTFRNRGPFQIRLAMSKQHDMNGDGRVEMNWFWLHDRSMKLIGWMPYEYLTGGRWNAEFFSMFPRVNQFDGFSIPERLADTVASMTANKNQRINYQDMVTSPVMVHRSGSDLRNKNGAVGPGVRWEAENPRDDIVYLAPPVVGGSTFQEDSQDQQNIAKVTGQSAPFTGGQGPTRQTSAQAKQASLAQSTRSATIALYYRFFLRRFITLALSLYRQFSDESFSPPELMGTDKSPLEILMMNMKVDVSGISDPVDAATRMQDMAVFTEQMMKIFPSRFQKPTGQFALAQAYGETVKNLVNLEQIIGTPEEAQQLEQQMMQAAQAAAQQEQKPGA